MSQPQLTENEQRLVAQIKNLQNQLETITLFNQLQQDSIDAHKTAAPLLKQRVNDLERALTAERDNTKQLNAQVNQLRSQVQSLSTTVASASTATVVDDTTVAVVDDVEDNINETDFQ